MWFQVFRLVSLWFTLFSRPNVVNSMLSTINEVHCKSRVSYFLNVFLSLNLSSGLFL
jgi:hypothetical protein